jgi:hypothetical protein
VLGEKMERNEIVQGRARGLARAPGFGHDLARVDWDLADTGHDGTHFGRRDGDPFLVSDLRRRGAGGNPDQKAGEEAEPHAPMVAESRIRAMG